MVTFQSKKCSIAITATIGTTTTMGTITLIEKSKEIPPWTLPEISPVFSVFPPEIFYQLSFFTDFSYMLLEIPTGNLLEIILGTSAEVAT